MSPIWSVLPCLFIRLTTTLGLDIKCQHRGNYRHSLPGSRCRQYYECRSGSPIERRCPEGTHYSQEFKACKVGGNCYELICIGRVDGRYSDTTEGCRRWYECSGGTVTAVESCPSGNYFNDEIGKCVNDSQCRKPKSSAIRIQTISNPCDGQEDGIFPVRDTSIFVKCIGQVEVETHQCRPGQNFDRRSCEQIMHLLDVCLGKNDGYHMDEDSCAEYVLCRNQRIVLKSSCPYGKAFDGQSCVPQKNVSCSNRRINKGKVHDVHKDCSDKEPGYYTNPESNCRSYYYCAQGKKITYICPPNEIFNGEQCLPKGYFNCPSVNTDCATLPDGYHRRSSGPPQDYIYCSKGDKLSTLQCGSDEVYDGERCVDAGQYSSKCHNVKFGYITDFSCRVYYLCRDGTVERSGVCLDKFIFNGKSCTPRTQTECDRGSIKTCLGVQNGFYPDFNTDCRQYYYCINGKKTSLSCPVGKIFNGDLCVPSHQYVCPSIPANQK